MIVNYQAEEEYTVKSKYARYRVSWKHSTIKNFGKTNSVIIF